MSQAQGHHLTKIFASIEERQSPIHGDGLFATSSIAAGQYSILPGDPKVAEMVEKFFSVNSAMMPDWRDILLLRRGASRSRADGSDGDDDASADAEDEEDFTRRLERFRTGFAAFVDEEDSKANIRSAAAVRAVADGVDCVVEVLRDLDEGDELLRPYGREWLAIKYHNLKSCMLHYRESMRKGDYEGDLVISVDAEALHATMWEFKSRAGGGVADDEDANAELGRYLSRREKKELVVVSPEELNSMANIIGMAAMEYLGTGDEGFDLAWGHNIRRLRSHFPRQVVNPASFASRAARKKSDGAKSKKSKRKHGEVEKRKHGAFDVYRMKM